MSTLNEQIAEKLKSVNSHVFYGSADSNSYHDYIVYLRENISRSPNKTSLIRHYSVGYISEDFVPEDIEESIVSAMLEIPGMKVADQDSQYSFIPGTSTANGKSYEILEIKFSKGEKVK